MNLAFTFIEINTTHRFNFRKEIFWENVHLAHYNPLAEVEAHPQISKWDRMINRFEWNIMYVSIYTLLMFSHYVSKYNPRNSVLLQI